MTLQAVEYMKQYIHSATDPKVEERARKLKAVGLTNNKTFAETHRSACFSFFRMASLYSASGAKNLKTKPCRTKEFGNHGYEERIQDRRQGASEGGNGRTHIIKEIPWENKFRGEGQFAIVIFEDDVAKGIITDEGYTDMVNYP